MSRAVWKSSSPCFAKAVVDGHSFILFEKLLCNILTIDGDEKPTLWFLLKRTSRVAAAEARTTYDGPQNNLDIKGHDQVCYGPRLPGIYSKVSVRDLYSK